MLSGGGVEESLDGKQLLKTNCESLQPNRKKKSNGYGVSKKRGEKAPPDGATVKVGGEGWPRELEGPGERAN